MLQFGTTHLTTLFCDPTQSEFMRNLSVASRGCKRKKELRAPATGAVWLGGSVAWGQPPSR